MRSNVALRQGMNPTELTKLKYLELARTGVTDSGLESLKGLIRLERLELGNTHVTAEGIEELSKALPNCMIHWDGAPNNKPNDQP